MCAEKKRRAFGSISEVEPGKWTVQLDVGRDPITGKRVRPQSTVRGTERDAELELTRIRARFSIPNAENLTVGNYLLAVWLPSKTDVRRRTLEEYKGKIARQLVPICGNVLMADFKKYQVERLRDELVRRDTGASTIRAAFRVLKIAMRDAVSWEVIDRDPTFKVALPKSEYEPVILDIAGINAYLDAFEGHLIEPIVLLAAATGMRRSELCAVDWRDIDFEQGFVKVRRGLHQSGADVWFEPPKTEHSKRDVTLPVWALVRLKELRGVGPLVMDGGERIAPQRVTKLYKEHIEKVNAGRKERDEAELPFVKLMCLRHSHATALVDSGVDMKIVAGVLGHKDSVITDQLYTRPHRVAYEQAAAAIEAIRPLPNAANVQEKGNQSEKVSGS